MIPELQPHIDIPHNAPCSKPPLLKWLTARPEALAQCPHNFVAFLELEDVFKL